MTETISVLAINTATTPAVAVVHKLEKSTVKERMLSLLNEMGKNSHLIVKWDGKLFAIHHTAPRGPSKKYFKSQISYHPFSAMLEKN